MTSSTPSLPEPPIVETRNLSLRFGTNQVLRNVSIEIGSRLVTAVIGPSGCGKSSFLRCLNRLNDLEDSARITGECRIGGVDIYAPDVDVLALRRRVGMVFQRSNPFPRSVYENIAFALRLHGTRDRATLDRTVEESLREAALWDEVKDRLRQNALSLSGGQQQRLCIARAIAVRPEILLMDEPASALDPIATGRIEELLLELKRRFTLIVVTHNLQQAARISDLTAFLYMGELVEYDLTSRVFTNPTQRRTEDYVTGRFG